MMISYITLGTNNFEQAVQFWDKLMTAMNARQAYATDTSVGWGWGIGTPMVIITRPFNQQEATFGNGTMVSFDVESPEKIDTLHAMVIDMGGTNEGDPGMRGEQLYAAYCRDLDGNKFNFIHYLDPPDS